MERWTERTRLLLGDEKLGRLRSAHVLVVGLGGVGAYAAEMIVRAGAGRLTIADADRVAETNINRQLVALHSTVGRPKAEVLAERLRDINPDLQLTVIEKYIRDEETDRLLDAAPYDYAVDAIDRHTPVGDAIETDFSAVGAQTPLAELRATGESAKITYLPVIDANRKLLGIVMPDRLAAATDPKLTAALMYLYFHRFLLIILHLLWIKLF